VRSRGHIALLAVLFLAAAPAPRTRDDFATAAGWTAAPSDGVSLDLASDHGALRLDFDFHGGAGYAVAHKAFAFALPANWQFSFRIRGEAPVNNLEFKLIDPSGENVWWINRKNFQFPRDWREVRNKKRQVAFAWGPQGGGEMKQVGAIEFAITAGSGGKGTVWIDDLTFTELPPEHPYDRTPAAISGPDWTGLDFLESREYGGLVIDWQPGADASHYAVEISDDGAAWRMLREVRDGNGGRDYLWVPETESRYLRVRVLAEGSGKDSKDGMDGIRKIDVKPLAWAPTVNDFFARIAADAPRGSYPRSFSGEQEYWTVVGVDGGTEEGLLGEDGALEVGQGAFSIEPFLWVDGELVSWSGVETAQTLAEGYLPIPTVTWRRGDLSLEITAFAAGKPGSSALHARYRVRNLGGAAKRLRLFLALRPFQVDPPAQLLNTPGGVSPIHAIAWDGRRAVVNGERIVVPESPPAAFGATSFDGGEISEHLRQGKIPAAASVTDPVGYASAAMAWDLAVPARGERAVEIDAPLLHARPHPNPSPKGEGIKGAISEPLSFRRGVGVRSQEQEAAHWHQLLDRLDLRLPPAAEPLVRTLKTSVAYMLINRDGPALQPGSRSYARTWIRDGALESAALLRTGHAAEVRGFLLWFAPYQFASGKVPCCVDARGADPVPENDSNGEFLFLAGEYWRFTRDRATVETVWPHVEKAVAYLDELRRQRRTDEYRLPGKRKFFGLLPESISHEGYSAHPVHSYWDDFFALTGLKSAADLAAALGKSEEAERWGAIRDEFRTDLYASLNRTIAEAGIDYIPGSADLADFDATSTTIALSPGGELASLPRPVLEHTFERYWREFVHRRSATDWDAYTPYELRIVGAFVRLGWKERAHELLDFFMQDRRPPGWNQWPEVVRRDPRAPGFLGDLPHTWVAAGFIRSFLDFFAYERGSDHALVLAAGVPADWLARPSGIEIRNLQTPWGPLSYRLRRTAKGVRYEIAAGPEIPPGGIVLTWPLAGEAQGGPVVVRRVPARVEMVSLPSPSLPSGGRKELERRALRSPHSPDPSLPGGERGKNEDGSSVLLFPSSPSGRGGVGEVRASAPKPLRSKTPAESAEKTP
jgi:hypothetical protein